VRLDLRLRTPRRSCGKSELSHSVRAISRPSRSFAGMMSLQRRFFVSAGGTPCPCLPLLFGVGFEALCLPNLDIQWPFNAAFRTEIDACRVRSPLKLFTAKYFPAMDANMNVDKWIICTFRIDRHSQLFRYSAPWRKMFRK